MNNNKMKAALGTERDNVRTSHRNENAFTEEYTAIIPAPADHWTTHYTPVTLRLYSVDGTRWTACLWVYWTNYHTSGSGSASGYGYHKPSAAAGCAIRDAGIKLSRSIDGRGEQDIGKAVEAIARAVTGKRKIIVHRAHA